MFESNNCLGQKERTVTLGRPHYLSLMIVLLRFVHAHLIEHIIHDMENLANRLLI